MKADKYNKECLLGAEDLTTHDSSTKAQSQQTKKTPNDVLFSGQNKAKEAHPLHTNKTSFSQDFARQIWLHYFNDYLRQHDIISEDTWRKMHHKIG